MKKSGCNGRRHGLRKGLCKEMKKSGCNGRRHGLIESLLILMVVLYAALLLCGPIAAIVWGALSGGLENLWLQLSSADALSALRLSLFLATCATVINTIFGTCVALTLARNNFRGRWVFNGLVDLPFAVPPVIAGLMVALLFGRNGWFQPIVDGLGVKVVFALPGMVLVTMFVSLPFVIRQIMPVLIQTGIEQEQAARTMGACDLQIFWHITLPSIRWGLLYGVSLTLARAIGEFGAVLVVSGGVSRLTESATLYIFRALDDRNYSGAYAMAVVLIVISLTILVVMQSLKRRVEARRRSQML
jgi:sulfate/thiosulfate transport system permease protein